MGSSRRFWSATSMGWCRGEMLQSVGINGHLVKYIQEFHFQTDNEKHFGLTMTRDLSLFYTQHTVRQSKESWMLEVDSIITD